MKNLNFTTLLYVFLLLILANSCSIEKRVHRPGYHIKFKKNLNISDTKEKIRGEQDLSAERVKDNLIIKNEVTDELLDPLSNYERTVPSHLVISSEKRISPTPFITQKKNNSFSEKCDNIILKNGDEIRAKVLEIQNLKIEYKKCDNLEGPTYIIDKSKVFMIKYANGTKDVFNTIPEVKTEEIRSNEVIQNVPKTDAMAVLSPVLAILGFLVGMFLSGLVGLILLLLGLIFGIIGISNTNNSNLNGRGAATAGLIISVISAFVIFVLLSAV